ncbi:uncharacterized protein LOC132293489 [Cornus florida]|uniref:uncharacterized protein LOC132293489 n=1 Tax=Cornus florida TaxID=4283 RepID=UPI0028A18D05|nr:uncharacterized protein LOC132293489 [Cornus florida]
MERVRLRRSKVTSINEGNRQTQKQRTVPKLASGSSSRSSGGTTEEELLTFDLAQSSSKRVTGTPIKKLLADEMSKETESKRRPPTVIGRLMGLDGLPPQQPVHKQQKGFSENYRQRTASIGFQRNDKLYDRRLNKKISTEQLEFKDVYEVSETLKVESASNPSKETTNSKLTEADIAFIQQKFLNAKCLSTNEKLQDSREFYDTLEMLDSNKDLLLEFLEQPDSLFTRHLLDLQDAVPRSQCSHIAVMKPSNYEKYESSAIGWNLEREPSLKCNISSQRKHQDGHFSYSYKKCGSHNSVKPSKMQLERKPETDVLPVPARIVVLKPNVAKMRNLTRSVPSPTSHTYQLDNRKHTEFPSIGNGEAGSYVKKNLDSDVGLSMPKFRESREIAKEITRRMRDSKLINLSSTSRGYAGDESSYSMSGSDSTSESEVTLQTSRNSFDWSSRQKLSSSHSVESSVSREAKKRLSERWKMTQRYHDVGVVCRGSTLGEMLAIPDRELGAENWDAMIGVDEPSERFHSVDETAAWDDPLGISSRDGWKDGRIRNLSRQFPPVSLVGCGGPMECEALDDDRYLMPKEAMHRGRNKALKGNLGQKNLSPRNLRSRNKKSQSSHHTYRRSIDSLQEIHSSQFQGESDLEKEGPSDQKPVVFEIPANNVVYTSSTIDAAGDPELESMTMPSECTDDSLTKTSISVLENGDPSARDIEDSKTEEPLIVPSEESPVPSQCPITEPHSPASSKEVDRLSPVSVLEVPFTEDVSSSSECSRVVADVSSGGSECFERVVADLHGLREQLKLLKMETETYAEGPMFMSSNEDLGEGFIAVSEDKEMYIEESWEASYLVDVLIDSGFNETDADTFMATWHSPDWPLGPGIFDNLEKKYCDDETTWSKSDRRLLFDRINSALLEISQLIMDPHPWVKPVKLRVGSKWQTDRIKNELQKLLECQEKSADEDMWEKVLEGESQWLYLGDEIDATGKEIERLVLDDLIAEVLTM